MKSVYDWFAGLGGMLKTGSSLHEAGSWFGMQSVSEYVVWFHSHQQWLVHVALVRYTAQSSAVDQSRVLSLRCRTWSGPAAGCSAPGSAGSVAACEAAAARTESSATGAHDNGRLAAMLGGPAGGGAGTLRWRAGRR